MDGLLIDSEPIWRRSEVEVFGRLGFSLTEEQFLETMGVPVVDVVRLWHGRHPWEGPSVEEVAEQIEAAVIEHVGTEGEPKPGVCEALAAVHAAGLPIAIASSSSEALIAAVVDRLNIAPYVQVICSADDEKHGKPHPDVYLTTARRLGVAPESCLAFEDSPNGVVAAKAAGMYCIAVPDPYLARDPRMDRADGRLASMEEFTPEMLRSLTGSPVLDEG